MASKAPATSPSPSKAAAVIKGLTGCALGFLGGLAVITLLLPDEVLAGTADAVGAASAPAQGKPFMRVALEG